MKLYAQHGFAPGDKMTTGVEKGYLDGVIYSPRDIGSQQLRTKIADVREISTSADQFFDPQYYAAYNVVDSEARLGRLATCDEYLGYFRRRTRRELERDTKAITTDIKDCVSFQNAIDVSAVIAPNIFITRSFDSIEGAIAKTFIRQAGSIHSEIGCKKPLYATLAVSREALLNRDELFSFLEDITVLDTPPEGFYILVGASSENARADSFHADVIAAWLLINQSLSQNGYRVINGYSDLLTPFLAAAGASAGATGWWSNSRAFSLGRFLPAGGGQLPIQRYLSKILLNRIRFDELATMIDLKRRLPGVPNVLNGLETDSLYPSDSGYEPARADEVLQSWNAIKSLCSELCRPEQDATLRKCGDAIKRANEAYDSVQLYLRLDPRSNSDHLVAIDEGLRTFTHIAEITEP